MTQPVLSPAGRKGVPDVLIAISPDAPLVLPDRRAGVPAHERDLRPRRGARRPPASGRQGRLELRQGGTRDHADARARLDQRPLALAARPAGRERAPLGRLGTLQGPRPLARDHRYLQHESQALFRHPRWKDVRLAELRSAWYQREITIPAGWAGRRIALGVEYLNSLAAVFVDGRAAGELRFPGGELDLTRLDLAPGTHARLRHHKGVSRGISRT
jgi:hypothetical protein